MTTFTSSNTNADSPAGSWACSASLPHLTNVLALAVDSERGRLIAACPGLLVTWTANGPRRAKLPRPYSHIYAVAVEPLTGNALTAQATGAWGGPMDYRVRIDQHGSSGGGGGADDVLSIMVHPHTGDVITTSVDGSGRRCGAPSPFHLTGHSRPVHAVAVDTRTGDIFTGGDDGVVAVWSADGQTQRRRRELPHGPIAAMAVLPSGALATACGCKVVIHDEELSPCAELSHGSKVHCMVLHPHTGHLVTGCDDGSLRVWDAAEGMQLCVLGGHGKAVRSLAVDERRGTVFSASWDKTIRVWQHSQTASLQSLMRQWIAEHPSDFAVRGLSTSTARDVRHAESPDLTRVPSERN